LSRRKLDPWADRQPVLQAVLAAVAEGRATLRQAAAAAGVHVATFCRWAARSPAVAEALAQARRRAPRPPAPPAADSQNLYRRRPEVPWHPRCPDCGRPVEVRRERGWYWWECQDAALGGCGWRSWRPRHPEDCPRCGRPRLWSWDRRSVVCTGCGVRVRAEAPRCEGCTTTSAHRAGPVKQPAGGAAGVRITSHCECLRPAAAAGPRPRR
jgi:hypothetical protein